MKVLLREAIEKLGARGEIVEVANGYARNYLIPRQVAVLATEANFRQLEMERARIAKLETKEKEERQATLQRLEATSCTLVAAASPEGHLYGSVGEQEIADILRKEGLPVEPGNVVLEEHFKETGVYVIEVRLAPDMVGQTRVWIVAE